MIKHVVLIVWLMLASCNPSNQTSHNNLSKKTELQLVKKEIVQKDSCELERLFVQKKLININSLDSSIRVVLHYSTNQNFLNKPIYNGLTDCYLPCEVAIKLCNAQQFLHHQFPNYHLIVFDAVRPLNIQKLMWNELQIPDKEKINYLAHPNDLSLHNYGAAVDIGIIGENDLLLDMGTPFDFFGELSKPKNEKTFIENGQLSKESLANRIILRNIMIKAGFKGITSEWWHFNSCSKLEAAKKFELIE